MHHQNESYKLSCPHCRQIIEIDSTKAKRNYYLGYSMVVALCPECGKYVILETEEDSTLFVNSDIRYYR